MKGTLSLALSLALIVTISAQDLDGVIIDAEGDLAAGDVDFMYDTFPDNFIWGVSTASFQVEGGVDADDKGPSIWDTFTTKPGAIEDMSNITVACNSYENYMEDIENIKMLGVSHYSFSISWARVMPDGVTENQPGMNYYINLIDALQAEGIKPIVTLYHWDLPEALERMGGWLNPAIVGYFEAYAQYCYDQLNTRVDMWVTLNDPWSVAVKGYGYGTHAPGQYDPAVNVYIAGHNLIRAHAKAYHAYDAFRGLSPGGLGQVGIALRSDIAMGADLSDMSTLLSAYHYRLHQLGWFAEPIFLTGDYPTIMKENIQAKSEAQGYPTSRLANFTADEIAENNHTADFFGLVFYTQWRSVPETKPLFPATWDNDIDTRNFATDDWVETGTEGVWSYGPGFKEALNWVLQGYGVTNNVPVYVLENGVTDRNGTLADANRITYFRQHINQALKARSEGVDLRGYVASSLMDSFTGPAGYIERKGLFSVNFSDPARPRTPKASALYYASVVRDNGFKRGYSGIGGQATGIVDRERSNDIMYGMFPSSYSWSAGSAAYVVEGAWNEDGKGESIWDNWAHANNINRGENGDVAVDSYHQYAQDVAAIKSMGANTYTFSISWPRLFPDGGATANENGAAYYDNLINELVSNNISPMVHLYHWDLPQALQDIGGWTNVNTKTNFITFADYCFRRYGDRVKTWMTMEDPETIANSGYGTGDVPPGVIDQQYEAAHNLILAHAEVYRLYEISYKAAQSGQVGITVMVSWPNPHDRYSVMDLEAAERWLDFTANWFLHPILGDGDYPAAMKERVAANSPAGSTRLTAITDAEKPVISGSADFIGIKYSSPVTVYESAPSSGMTYEVDRMVATMGDMPSTDTSDIAAALRKSVTWVKARYPNYPVYVSANSVSDTNGTTHDWHRVHQLRLNTNQLLKAISLDMVDVRGFNYWTLVDGFMWNDGWMTKTGLFSVDRNSATFPRTQKASAIWYRTLIADGGFKEGYTQPGGWGTYIDKENEFVYETVDDDFMFGVATAAYQVEGAWDQDGKGVSIWDTFTQAGRTENGQNGNIAADHYNMWADDIKLIKDLGAQHYRFSISWPRIMPTGTGAVNQAGIDHYSTFIDALIAEGITPVITMYGWDLPQALQDQGGWLSDDSPQWFEDYANILFSNYGDRVKLWITINEPWAISALGHGAGNYAPGITDPFVSVYNVTHHLILAHAMAYRLYEASYKSSQQGMIGFTLHCDWYEPMDMIKQDDIDAARRAQMFYIGWWAEPIFLTGDYPQEIKDQVTDGRLPVFTAAQMAMVKNSSDFFGINHYTTSIATTGVTGPGWFQDSNVATSKDPSWLTTGADWLQLNPIGFRKVLNWVYHEYMKPVLVTESGMPDRNGTLDDDFRSKMYQAYVDEMIKAIKIDNIDIVGYTARTLIDTFEWAAATLEKWGLYSVDFNDPALKRTPKASARFVYELYRDRGFIEGAYTDPANPTELAYEGFPYAGQFPNDFIFGASSTTISADMNEKDCPNAEMDSLNFDDSLDAFSRGDLSALHMIEPTVYMFTLSWRRIMPNGIAGGVNQRALDYYHSALDLLKDEDVMPFVSLHQWDYPCFLGDGWDDPRAVEEFVAYARVCFENFGDKVKWWITIDQVNQVPFYVPSLINNDPRMYTFYRNAVLGHAEVYRMYESEFKPTQMGMVGVTIHPLMTQAINPNDPNHANSEFLSNEFTFGLAGDPIFKDGDFSDTVKQYGGANLDALTDEQKEMIKGSADFLGVAYYFIMPVGADVNPQDQKSLYAAFYPDASSIDANGLRTFLLYTAKRYPGFPIIVTETGAWTATDTPEDAATRGMTLNNLITAALEAAVVDDLDVRGFIYRSLVDNYVWEYGYNRRYGTYEYPNYVARESASTYHMIIESGAVLRSDQVTSGGTDGGSDGDSSTCPPASVEPCDCSAYDGALKIGVAAPLAALLICHVLYRAFGAFMRQ